MANGLEVNFLCVWGNGLDAILDVPVANGCDLNFLCVLANGLDAIFLLAVGNFDMKPHFCMLGQRITLHNFGRRNAP